MASTDHHSGIVINGTHYEGGGGLVRDTLSYASILNKPVMIKSIRANRPGNGGLRLEHTVGVEVLSKLSAATVEGNTPCSRDVLFHPHAAPQASCHRDALHSLDIRTEGSAVILMVAIIPYVLFSALGPSRCFTATEAIKDGIKFTIHAGTLCVKAPSFAYVQQVMVPMFQLVGIGKENLRVEDDHEQGWHTDFVRTPGRMTVWVKPLETPLPAFRLHGRGRVVRIRATAHGPKGAVVQFQQIVRRELEVSLKTRWSSSIKVLSESFPSTVADQFHLLLVAETDSPKAFLGYEQVYPQQDRFPDGLANNTERLLTHITLVCIRGLYDELRHGNAVDEHMQNILVPYQVLSDGFSSATAKSNKQLVTENEDLEVPLEKPNPSYYVDTTTLHQRTSVWVASEMTGVEFSEKDGHFGCQGIGLGANECP